MRAARCLLWRSAFSHVDYVHVYNLPCYGASTTACGGQYPALILIIAVSSADFSVPRLAGSFLMLIRFIDACVPVLSPFTRIKVYLGISVADAECLESCIQHHGFPGRPGS